MRDQINRARHIRRRESTLPTLMVPLTRGPIQGFFHFFVGYFVPVYWERVIRPDEELTLMSVPSFNHWFDLLPGAKTKIIDPAKVAKHCVLRNRRGYSSHYRVTTIDFWDKWERFGEKPFREVAERVHSDLREKLKSKEPVQADVVILGRSPVKRFPGEEFARPSGLLARNIENMVDMRAALDAEFATDFLDGSVMTPDDAFLKCHNARLILGQHGAGLSNVFFAKPGSSMMEIVWPALAKRAEIDIYASLCEALGIQWSRTSLQETPNSPVNTLEVVRQIRLTLEH